jgi:hypothetical protein
MPEINIKVRDKCAEGEGVIICNNSDYTVVWDLDGEWTPYDTKTMRVNLADGTYQDVVFTGDTATLPVLTASGWVSVGLYAGDLHTSRAARLLALSSVLTPGGSPAAPAEDVYAQIMAKLNELSTVSPEDIAKAVEDYLAEHPAASASMRVEDGYIQFSGDGENWDNVIALADLKGPKGDTGATGPQGPAGAGMDITGATVGQIAKISAVDAEGKPTAWETIDGYTGQVTVDNLTNPDHPTDLVQYAAFQAAVPMVQQMGIFGATVGQIIKVKAVNSDGCPTAWEPVDMPAGGGEDEWELINTISITEPVHAIDITIDSNGEAFSLKKIFIYSPLGLKADGNSQVFIELYSGASTAMYFRSMNDAIEKSPKALFAEFDVVGSFYREYLLTSTYHLEDVMSQNVGLMLSKNKGPITRISISLQYNYVFTNGEFQIYGVRE